MKLIIEEDNKQEECEIIIRCACMDERLEKLVAQIRSYTFSIKGIKEGHMYVMTLTDIHYFESVDDQVYIYTQNDVYESDKKLYELEEQLRNTRFVRISKSCIVNVDALVHVRPLFDGKFIATTQKKEELVINRHYVKAFKEVFGL